MSDLFGIRTSPLLGAAAALTGDDGSAGGGAGGIVGGGALALAGEAGLSARGYVADAQGGFEPTGGSAALTEGWQREWARSEELYYRTRAAIRTLPRLTVAHERTVRPRSGGRGAHR